MSFVVGLVSSMGTLFLPHWKFQPRQRRCQSGGCEAGTMDPFSVETFESPAFCSLSFSWARVGIRDLRHRTRHACFGLVGMGCNAVFASADSAGSQIVHGGDRSEFGAYAHGAGHIL